MKVRFHCVKRLDDVHDADVKLSDLIAFWPPMCCGKMMVPVDANEWDRMSRALDRSNNILVNSGLPNLADLLLQAREGIGGHQ
jgi:hypothetical protein